MEHANNLYLEKSLVSIEKKHLSSVQIREYPDSGFANPEPYSDTQEDVLEDFLSPEFLVSYKVYYQMTKRVFMLNSI